MFERRKAIASLLGLGMSVVLCGGSGALAQQAAGAPAPEDNAPRSSPSNDFLSWAKGNGNGSDGTGPWDRRTYRNVDITHDLELSFAVGAVVTLAVGISRRRRKRTPA